VSTDATTQLIQRILSQLPSGGAAALESNTNLISQVNTIVNAAASYAQILGATGGLVAQAAAFSTIDASAIDILSSGAGAEAAALAGAQTAGVGAAVVLIISFLLAALSSDSGSTETQQLNQLNSEVEDIEDVVLANYWQDKVTSAISFWNSPTGGLGTDLDNLANEGTGGTDVKNDVTHFHDNALAFVNNLIPSKTPGAAVYWERPVVQSQLFSAQAVVYQAPLEGIYGPEIGSIMGWYGQPPRPLSGPALGGSAQQMASDPRSMLPFLLLGIKSYLTIEAVVHVIDPSQPTFNEFLTQFQGDIQDYASFLYSQYQLAVNGIVKTDLPSTADVLSYLWFMAEEVHGAQFADNSILDVGSEFYQYATGSWAYTGYAWNGVYGAADSYPQYGVYQPIPPVPVPFDSPSYIIDVFNTDNFVSEVSFAFSYEYEETAALTDWIPQWVADKLILGRMARWKAIFLLNGYDKIWSILQNLRVLSNQSPLPALTLDQDGTIANGNWSVLELFSVLNADANVDSNQTTDATFLSPDLSGPYSISTWPGAGYSLFSLVRCLDIIANGNWAGSPGVYSLGPSTLAFSRPVSFRERLAAAAL
jgi:hypothetical protein